MRLLPSLHKRLLKQRRFRQALVGSLLSAMVIGWLIVPIEKHHPDSSIQSTSDGLWWAIQTVTTVGYGDVTPVTDLGRLMGVVLVLMGAAMYGVVIAMISSSMSRSQEEFYWNRLFERLDRLEKDVSNLQKDTTFMVKNQTEPDHSQPRP